jgi:hypothetical protein
MRASAASLQLARADLSAYARTRSARGPTDAPGRTAGPSHALPPARDYRHRPRCGALESAGRYGSPRVAHGQKCRYQSHFVPVDGPRGIALASSSRGLTCAGYGSCLEPCQFERRRAPAAPVPEVGTKRHLAIQRKRSTRVRITARAEDRVAAVGPGGDRRRSRKRQRSTISTPEALMRPGSRPNFRRRRQVPEMACSVGNPHPSGLTFLLDPAPCFSRAARPFDGVRRWVKAGSVRGSVGAVVAYSRRAQAVSGPPKAPA